MEIENMTDSYAKELCKQDTVVVCFRSTVDNETVEDRNGDAFMVKVVDSWFENLLLRRKDYEKALVLSCKQKGDYGFVPEACYREEWCSCDLVGISPNFVVLKVRTAQ